jgi:hypothetical protein
MSGRVLFSNLSLLAQSSLILTVMLASQPGVAQGNKGGGGGREGTGAGLSVASPTVPPGGLLQMQIFMTEPKPILKGKQGVHAQQSQALDFEGAGKSASLLGALRDAAIFSPDGDVSGVAVTNSSGTQFFFTSPLASYGTSTDTPVITIAYPVSTKAAAGQTVDLTLDPTDCQWVDPNGDDYTMELKSGVMTVGGALSISDVVPGDGVVPAGTVISITGTGFQSSSKVDFGEVHVASTQYVNSTLMQVTLRNSADVRGQRVRIDNPDNERAEYFPYQRTKRTGKSKHPLVAAGYPMFSQTPQTVGYFQPTLRGTVYSGLALQNLNATKAKATLQLYSQGGVLLSQRTLSLATNTYIARDLVELFPGTTPGDGTKLTVTSNQPILMLGLLGDDASGTLLPVPASSTP